MYKIEGGGGPGRGSKNRSLGQTRFYFITLTWIFAIIPVLKQTNPFRAPLLI